MVDLLSDTWICVKKFCCCVELETHTAFCNMWAFSNESPFDMNWCLRNFELLNGQMSRINWNSILKIWKTNEMFVFGFEISTFYLLKNVSTKMDNNFGFLPDNSLNVYTIFTIFPVYFVHWNGRTPKKP